MINPYLISKKPQNTNVSNLSEITLKFDVHKNERGNMVIKVVDQIGRQTIARFSTLGSNVPATMLSRWFAYHCQKDLIKLAGKGSSVEYVVSGEENIWKYRDDVELFGLHDIISQSGRVLRLSIDDSIGMKNVVAILNRSGYTVEPDFDPELNRMKSIKLTKVGV